MRRNVERTELNKNCCLKTVYGKIPWIVTRVGQISF